MNGVLSLIVVVAVAAGMAYIFGLVIDKKAEKKVRKEFAKRMESYKRNVKKYAKKFNASLDHLIAIKDVFHELVESNKLEYLKPFEAYSIPVKRYHFATNFYILTTENLEYRIVIYADDVYSESIVKKLLPFSMTLEEFDKFIEECRNENFNNGIEKHRRNEIEKVLRNVNK